MIAISDLLKKIASDLDISQSRYDSAEKSYQSIGTWLKRDDSKLKGLDVKVYLQGSFRLGTAIKPFDSDEHYDLDIVCEVDIEKRGITQEEFQNLIGSELTSYAKSYGMDKPEKWDRCWTLNYSEGARFHIDFLPAVPDGAQQTRILNESKLSPNEYTTSSIAITDRKHFNFQNYSTIWPVSNPHGYAEWFKSKMRPSRTLAEAVLNKRNVDVSEIPVFKRQTALQLAIKILKRHRDVMFLETPEFKPSSVILTTLATYSYSSESDLGSSITSILSRMQSFILHDSNGLFRIENPTDRRENFADAWNAEPKKSEHFFDWLETAKRDFEIAAQAANDSELLDALAPRLGRRLVESGLPLQKSMSLPALAGLSNLPEVILDAPHRRPMRWPFIRSKIVNIFRVMATTNGVQRKILSNDNVRIGDSLSFEAKTDAVRPFQVYWQVVNTGEDAKRAGNLRGNFDEDKMTQGTLTKTETATYIGTHSVQCFIVKDRKCIARSPVFLVSIK